MRSVVSTMRPPSTIVRLAKPDASASSFAMTAALHVSEAYYRAQAVVKEVQMLDKTMTETVAEVDGTKYKVRDDATTIPFSHRITVHPCMRVKLSVACALPEKTYVVDYGQRSGTVLHLDQAVMVEHDPSISVPVPSGDLSKLLVPLSDDVSPNFPGLDPKHIVVFMPAGAGSTTINSQLTGLCKALTVANHEVLRRSIITPVAVKTQLLMYGDVVRSAAFLLPNTTWLPHVHEVIKTIQELDVGRKIYIVAIVLDGQRMDAAGEAILAASDVIIAKEFVPRNVPIHKPAVVVPGMFETPQVLLDVIGQCIGAVEQGVSHVIGPMSMAAAAKGFPVLPVIRF